MRTTIGYFLPALRLHWSQSKKAWLARGRSPRNLAYDDKQMTSRAIYNHVCVVRCASERVRGVNALRAYLNQSESRLRYAPFGLLPISTNCDVTSATLLHCWVNFSGRHSGGVSLRCITSLCLQVTLRLTTCKVNVRRGYYFAWFKRVDCIISYRVTCCHLINTHSFKTVNFSTYLI